MVFRTASPPPWTAACSRRAAPMSTRPSSTPIYDTELGGTIVIPAKLTTIDPYAFYDTKLSHKLLAKVSCKSKWKGFKLFTPTSRQLHANYSRQQFA